MLNDKKNYSLLKKINERSNLYKEDFEKEKSLRECINAIEDNNYSEKYLFENINNVRIIFQFNYDFYSELNYFSKIYKFFSKINKNILEGLDLEYNKIDWIFYYSIKKYYGWLPIKFKELVKSYIKFINNFKYEKMYVLNTIKSSFRILFALFKNHKFVFIENHCFYKLLNITLEIILRNYFTFEKEKIKYNSNVYFDNLNIFKIIKILFNNNLILLIKQNYHKDDIIENFKYYIHNSLIIINDNWNKVDKNNKIIFMLDFIITYFYLLNYSFIIKKIEKTIVIENAIIISFGNEIIKNIINNQKFKYFYLVKEYYITLIKILSIENPANIKFILRNFNYLDSFNHIENIIKYILAKISNLNIKEFEDCLKKIFKFLIFYRINSDDIKVIDIIENKIRLNILFIKKKTSVDFLKEMLDLTNKYIKNRII